MDCDRFQYAEFGGLNIYEIQENMNLQKKVLKKYLIETNFLNKHFFFFNTSISIVFCLIYGGSYSDFFVKLKQKINVKTKLFRYIDGLL